MQHRFRDARRALRGVLRTPLLCTVTALSLALGSAADTTFFSALDALSIRPLPDIQDLRRADAVTLAVAGRRHDGAEPPGAAARRSRTRRLLK